MKKRRLKAKHAFSSCYRTAVKPIAAHDPSNATSAWHIWAGPENRSTGMQQTVVVVVVSRETSRKQSHRLIPVVVSCCWSAFRPALTAWGRLTSPRPRPSVRLWAGDVARPAAVCYSSRGSFYRTRTETCQPVPGSMASPEWSLAIRQFLTTSSRSTCIIVWSSSWQHTTLYCQCALSDKITS